MNRLAAFLLASPALLAACAANDAGLPNGLDLQYKIRSYYENAAQERGATCNLPRMAIGQTRIVDETPTQLTLDVSYNWQDTTYGSGSPFGGFTGGNCFGTSRRQFVVSKNSDGSYTVEKMSGAQR